MDTVLNKDVGRASRWLLQAAMGIFVVTVVIGILNGLDVIEFERNALLTHLHSGTLGWITLGFFAAALQLFQDSTGGEDPWPTRIATAGILAVVSYVIAFYATTGIFRPLAGAFTFAVILALFGWVVRQASRTTMTIPRLAVLAGMVNLVVGAVIGLLLGLQLAGRDMGLSDGAFLAHGSAMIGGYVILAGMAIAEWKLIKDPKPARKSRAGIAQVVLMFLAGLVFAVGAFLDNLQLITMNVPLMVIGTIIFLSRVGRSALKPSYGEASSGRMFSISVVFLVINISLLAYLISQLVAAEGDVTQIPFGVVLAMDHALFIGVMANVHFGQIYDLTQGRRQLWGWANQVTYWAINIGIAGFLAGLLADNTTLKRIFTPLMGTGILLAILVYTLRFNSQDEMGASTGPQIATP